MISLENRFIFDKTPFPVLANGVISIDLSI